jgi:hypothetical protein
MADSIRRWLRLVKLPGASAGLLSVSVLFAASVAAQNAPPIVATQSPPPDQASAILDEIEVRGRRMGEVEFNLRRFVMDFVLEVTRVPSGRGFARWQRRVCVGVHNLDAAAAQYLVDRISLLALDVGLDPGEPGCAPQVMIIFTVDAIATATQLVERERGLFQPVPGNSGTTLGLEALEAFRNSDRAVRWWHVSLPVDARTGAAAIPTPNSPGPPTIAVAGPSRIYSGIRDDLQRVIVIVDATRLSGLTWQQLGDYLAVISLAPIDPNANPSAFDSILNLFSTPQYYSGLTDWDRSYVRAMYEFDQERHHRLQRGALVNRIMMSERRQTAAE